MATNSTATFTINLNGNAYNGIVRLSDAVKQNLNPAIERSESLFGRLGSACFALNNIFDMVGRTVGKVVGKLSEFERAGRAQTEAETKLAQVMRNTMSESIVAQERMARASRRTAAGVTADAAGMRASVEDLALSFRELPGKTGFDMQPLKLGVEIQPVVSGESAIEGVMNRIRELTAKQQRTGVIGDEIQMAGAQELAVHLTNPESLEKLIPVMNDLTAKQQGFNATQEGAASVAAMMGKAMDGNVMMLERAGIKFSEVQKKIMQTGDEAQRAATLADVLTQKVGGMNEALANTPDGRVVQLNNAYGDLQERLGLLWTGVKDTLYPVFNGLIERVDSLIDTIEGRMDDAKAWISSAIEQITATWERIKGPVVETAQSLWNSLRAIVGNILNSVAGIVRDHIGVVRMSFSALLGVVRGVGRVFAWLSRVVSGFVNFVNSCLPVILGLAGAIGIVTLAIKAQAIETAILNGATSLGVAIGTLYAKVWTVVNAVMTANPVGLIIAGVVALAGVIVFLCMKIKGWGTLWEAVVNFAKNTFFAFTTAVELKWTALINGFMIGIDKMKEAWYKFRNAVGLGEKSANDEALAKIADDLKSRQRKIADVADKEKEYLKAAADSWKGVHLEWDTKATPKKAVDKIKAQLGITDASAVTNNITDNTENNNLQTDLSDASTKISSGGKNIKNINITINDGLINRVQNYFNSSDDNPETADDFLWRLSNALQLVVNDVNYD